MKPSLVAVEAPVSVDQQPTQVAEATTSPASEGFNFGGRDFKLLPLDYESFLNFTLFLYPLLEGVAAKIMASKGVSLPGIEVAELDAPNIASYFLKFCRKELPEMVCIVCNQQPGEKVTPDWIKQNAKSPIQLATIVILQVSKNQMLSEFADFFVQVLPILMTLSNQKKP